MWSEKLPAGNETAVGGAAGEIAAGQDMKGNVLQDFSQLWSNIQIRAGGFPPKVLLVTSSKRKEGVTFLLYHLGKVIAAQEGKKTLLVDCNTYNPSLHRIFHLPPGGGFMDICRGQVSLEDCLRDTSLPRLKVTPFGNYKGYQALPSNSEALHAFFQAVRSIFDTVLVDAPPIHDSPYPSLLGKYSDGVILTLLSGSTKREVVLSALNKINHLNEKFLGVVLNRRKFYIPSFLYGFLK